MTFEKEKEGKVGEVIRSEKKEKKGNQRSDSLENTTRGKRIFAQPKLLLTTSFLSLTHFVIY